MIYSYLTINITHYCKENYANIYIEHRRNKEEMNEALMAFPVYYIYRRHGGVRKEPGVKTPFQAIEKPVVSKAEPWFMLKPEIFKQNPCEFKNKIIHSKPVKRPIFQKRP